MTPLAQADLKGTYDQAYEDTKELINQDQGNTLDWFLQQEKTYNSATAVAKTKDLEKNTTDDAVTIAKFDAATPTEGIYTLDEKNIIDDANVKVEILAADGTTITKTLAATDYTLEVDAATGESKIKLVTDQSLAAQETLKISYTHTAEKDKNIKEALQECLDNLGSSAPELYTAYLTLLKGADAARGGGDDLDISTLEGLDRQGLQEILTMVYKKDPTIIDTMITERFTDETFNLPEVEVDTNVRQDPMMYTESPEQLANIAITEAFPRDTQNAVFFKMMYGEADVYDANIVIDMLKFPEIEKNAITASGVDLATNLTKAKVEVDTDYTTEQEARKTNIDTMLTTTEFVNDEYGYGIGAFNKGEGTNTGPLDNFEDLYRKAFELDADAEVDFDTLFEADEADPTKFTAITKMKEMIKNDLDPIYHETEYTDKIDQRETDMIGHVEELKTEKFYELKLDASDSLSAFWTDNIENSTWTTLNGQDIGMVMTDLILKAPAYDGKLNEVEPNPKNFFDAVLNIKNVTELQQLIYDNIGIRAGKDTADRQAAFIESNQTDDTRNGTIGFETIKDLAFVIAGSESPYEGLDEEAVKEMIEKMAEFNENMGTYLQMPPEELLDPTNGNLKDEKERELFKRVLETYKVKDIDRNIDVLSGVNYNGGNSNTNTDFLAIFENHRGNISLEHFNELSDTTNNDNFYSLLATNVGSVKIEGFAPFTPDSSFGEFMRSQTVTDISIGRDKIDTITARELAWKTHGTLYLDDLDQIELEPVTRFGPESTALLSMMGMKEIIDGDVVKYLAETEKKLLLQPGIELAEYEGTLGDHTETLQLNESTTEEMKLVANDIDPFTLEKEDIGTDTIVVKNGATELKEGVDYVIGESKKTIRLITNITIATGESLTVDYKYEVEPACAYRYDEELQMIVPIAGEEKPEEGNEEVSEKEGTVPEEGEETPEDKVEETPEEYIKKGDEILEKTPENQKKWNKGEALNQTEKSYFYVVIEMIYTLPESDQKTELINLLEGGKLGDFQRKIGVPEQVNGEYLIDGCFGKITLYYLQVYLKITITVPVPGRIKEEPKYLIGETPADPIGTLPEDNNDVVTDPVVEKPTEGDNVLTDPPVGSFNDFIFNEYMLKFRDQEALEFKDGRYKGEVNGNLRQGKGILYKDEACTQEIYGGNWENNKMHGVGRYTTEKGAKIRGTREDGLLIKVVKIDNGELEFNPGLEQKQYNEIEEDTKDTDLQTMYNLQNKSENMA